MATDSSIVKLDIFEVKLNQLISPRPDTRIKMALLELITINFYQARFISL